MSIHLPLTRIELLLNISLIVHVPIHMQTCISRILLLDCMLFFFPNIYYHLHLFLSPKSSHSLSLPPIHCGRKHARH